MIHSWPADTSFSIVVDTTAALPRYLLQIHTNSPAQRVVGPRDGKKHTTSRIYSNIEFLVLKEQQQTVPEDPRV